MPITLAQARNLVQDRLSETIIDEFRKSPLLDMMIFDNVVSPQGSGSSLVYNFNRVTTFGNANFRAINSEYTPGEAATTPQNVELKVLGSSFEIDRVVAQDMEGIADNLQFQFQQAAIATRALFEDSVINGDSAVNGESFDGLDKVLTGTSTEHIPTAPIDLSTATAVENNWKAFLREMRLWKAKLTGNPDLYLVSREMYAVIQTVADFSTQFNTSKDEFGNEIMTWGQTPIVEMGDKPGSSNGIIATETGTDGTTTGCSSIYAVRMGLDAVHGISPRGDKLIREYFPNFERPEAVKKGEVEMVGAVVVKATRSAGVLRDIKIA